MNEVMPSMLSHSKLLRKFQSFIKGTYPHFLHQTKLQLHEQAFILVPLYYHYCHRQII